jgi:hypothetical protein
VRVCAKEGGPRQGNCGDHCVNIDPNKLSIARARSLIATGRCVCVEAARSSEGFVELAHARHAFEALLDDVLILSRCAMLQRAIFLHFGACAADNPEVHGGYVFRT